MERGSIARGHFLKAGEVHQLNAMPARHAGDITAPEDLPDVRAADHGRGLATES